MGQVRRGRAALLGAGLLTLALVGAALAAPSPSLAATAATDAARVPLTCGELSVASSRVHCLSDITFPSTAGVHPFATTGSPPGWSPQDIAAMDDLPPVPAEVPTGTGATVALVEADHTPSLAADLDTYRSQYRLGACPACLTTVNQTGGSTPPARSASLDGWDWETTMDAEAVAAACPACRTLVVEADSTDSDDLDAALATAAARADYVSISWGSDDGGATAADFASTEAIFAAHPDVTFVASSGDYGWRTVDLLDGEVCGRRASTAGGGDTHSCTSYPASSPHVVAAGGTTATESGSAGGVVWSQQTWGDQDDDGSLNAGGSSSGCSGWTSMTAAQATDPQAVAACGTARGTADISALADGFALYHAVDGYTWTLAGGTSLAAPLLTAMYARAGNHTSPFDIYARAHAAATAGELTDITGDAPTRGCPSTDTRHLCGAGPGWDGPTGLGTPHGLAALRTLTDPTPIDTPVQAQLSPTETPPGPPNTTAPTSGTPAPQAIGHSGKVRVKGKARPHRRLRAAYGSFGGGASATVTWLLDGHPVAHGRHLTVKRAWLHHRIRYVVTAGGAGLVPLTLRSPTVRVHR